MLERRLSPAYNKGEETGGDLNDETEQNTTEHPPGHRGAGHCGTLNKFAVWDSKNLEEASYEIYYSDRMVGHRYSIGDEIVSWDGSNHGTQTRRIAVLDYNHVQPGTYNGVINYGIALKDKA